MRKRTGLAIALTVFLGVLAAAGESSAYTQSYVTYWQTTPQGGGIYEYKYWVLNTGTMGSSYECAPPNLCGAPPPPGTGTTYDSVYNERILSLNPQVREYYNYRQEPVIWDYEVPILTEGAFNSIVPGSIFQPGAWNYEFLDPAGIWVNTTGDSTWDNPYKILHWYTSANPIRFSWVDPGGPPTDGDCWMDYEMCAESFGYQSPFGAVLGPDQTSWTLDIYENLSTRTIPIETRRGDPDLMQQSNGVGGGGIPLALVAPQQGTPIPEPSTVLLMGAGLIGLGLWGRKRLAGRS